MMSIVLRSLEKLQADLVAIDPSHGTEAADAVADIAVVLREALAQKERTRRLAPASPDTVRPGSLRAAG